MGRSALAPNPAALAAAPALLQGLVTSTTTARSPRAALSRRLPGSLRQLRGRGIHCALLAAATVFLLGCQHTLDMPKLQGEQRAATTVRYLGVRGETRLYPDYSALNASILAPPAGAPQGTSTRPVAPQGAPR
ncbi:Hypothetical protein CAP_0069 [Chondromyces apiculatus DSM 436]|uniref:Uncharacterized protein n=2 Tax=Chondromyces apiculatus TaxID=51 RepID=A0A017TJH0_9BACT|nr:Hypothetical protein CAP_0069 [Chondromyces apiculatus DSM 436]